MKSLSRSMIATLLVSTWAAAAALVAMRVEVEAIAPAGGETLVEIVVHIAPEDRVRIGPKALVQGELKHGKKTIERFARTVEVSAGGQARLEVQLRPGQYDLRIDVESAAGNATGFWMGRIDVPRISESSPTPAPAFDHEDVGAAAAAAAAIVDADDPPPVAAVADAAVATAPEQSRAAPSEPEPPIPEAAEPEPPIQGAAVTSAADAAAEVTATVVAANADTTTITVVVTDRNQPILGFSATDFRLRLDGRDAVIDSVGDKRQAPLWLGLAIDISKSMEDYLSSMNRHITAFSLRASGGVFLVTGDATPRQALDWGATATDLANVLGAIGGSIEGDIGAMVSAALGNFSQKSGRKILVVVTDGGDAGSKESWRIAAEAAAEAGVQVLVIGFRGDGLKEKTRSHLEHIASSTGGRSYFLADVSLFEMTLDYLGQLADASVAVSFSRDGDGLRKIKLTTTNKGFDVHHPKTVR